jgi:pimeloyl-ACP methyl ester carboxylesterase
MLPRRAFLGAELAADDLAFGDGGVRLAGVRPDGLVAGAGLVAGDLVVTVAGLPVRDPCELGEALRRAGALAEVELVYRRGDACHTARAGVVAMSREQLDGIAVELGELHVAPGIRLRTLATPVHAARSLVLVLQGIACESVDHAATPDAPLAALIAAWARCGHATLRFDKRGTGDSEGGPCRANDFHTELADARHAYAAAVARARGLGVPLFLFGHSVGGIVTGLLAGERRDADPLAGVIVYGAPVRRWLDCLLDSARRQLALRGASPEECDAGLAAIRRLATTGELNGRSAAYHAQLDGFELEPAWRAVDVPVLVVRGEHDWVVSADDQARIAALARRGGDVIDVPGLDHLFGWHADRDASVRDYGAGGADPALARATSAWLDVLCSQSFRG